MQQAIRLQIESMSQYIYEGLICEGCLSLLCSNSAPVGSCRVSDSCHDDKETYVMGELCIKSRLSQIDISCIASRMTTQIELLINDH